MRLHLSSALVALSLTAATVFAAPQGVPGASGGDVNAVPAGPNLRGNADNQREAEAAFARARAECRGAERGTRRDCVTRSQQDFDKSQRVVKPPRRPPPESAASR